RRRGGGVRQEDRRGLEDQEPGQIDAPEGAAKPRLDRAGGERIMTTCPLETVLRRYLDDDLEATVEAGVEEHAQACNRCQETLKRLSGGDEADRWRALLGTGMRRPHDERIAVPFLSPQGQPG